MMNQTKRTDPIKICFVAPGLTVIYSLLSGKNPKTMGGPDVHIFLLTKELIKHNFKISIIVHDEGGMPIEYIDGIEIIKINKDAYCLKILNIVLELFRIWNAMRKTNAHIYIQRGSVPGAVSPFCRLTRKKFVFCIASDSLVNRELIKKVKEFNRSIFSSLSAICNWLDIKLADVIIVQNEYQKKMLKKNFGKDGILIKKPFPLTERGIPEKAKPPIVLWAGAMAEVKQPELFLKLAESMSEAKFQIIGGPSGDEELYNRIKERSKRISNSEFLGVIPFDKINKYFSRALILVNTSMFEAYPPHAFLQAWMNYTPVVSLHDNSDELICNYNMGFHSKTFEQMVKDVKILLKDEKLREEMGENGRKYVEREHDLTTIVREYIKLFDRIGEF